jgi:broad specificity phosphatase PhoE
VWLVRAGTATELEERRRALATVPLALVLAPPDGAEEAWAMALAAATTAALERDAELRAPAASEPDEAVAARAWPALERRLRAGHARVLLVLSAPVLRLCVARALELPLERASVLRVEPGRSVCLRDDPIGLVLRRANVRAPEDETGMPLPAGTREGWR